MRIKATLLPRLSYGSMDRTRMLREQAKRLRDLAEAPGQLSDVRERMHKPARDCEELVNALQRSLERS
jgi:hypothetical protein